MDERVATCLLFSKVLAADGIVTENERTFLNSAMDKLAIAPDDRTKIINLEGWDEAEKALLHLSEDAKRAIIGELIDAASADGRLSPLEAGMVKRISVALGLPPV